MSGIYLILQNPKPHIPSPKPQVSSSKSVLNLGLGIWDLELYSMKMLNLTDTKQPGSWNLELGIWDSDLFNFIDRL